jgi:hypothetical protein
VTAPGRRLWRTENGGLVEDGDPAGVTLAYGPGDQLTAADEALLAGETEDEEAGQKQASRPADKSRRPGGDKTRGR